jgi:hypothetical protein
MGKGVGRRRIIWALFWIAVLGSGSAIQGGGASVFRGADPEPVERLAADHWCPAERVSHAEHVGRTERR